MWPFGGARPKRREIDAFRAYAVALVERHTGSTDAVFLEREGSVRPYIREGTVDYPLNDATWKAIQDTARDKAVATPSTAMERPVDAWCALIEAQLLDQGAEVRVEGRGTQGCQVSRVMRVVDGTPGPNEVAASEVGAGVGLVLIRYFPGDTALERALAFLVERPASIALTTFLVRRPSSIAPTTYLARRLERGAGWADWWSFGSGADALQAVRISSLPHEESEGVAGDYARRLQLVVRADYYITNGGMQALCDEWSWFREPGHCDALLEHYRSFGLDHHAQAIELHHGDTGSPVQRPLSGEGSPERMYAASCVADALVTHWRQVPPPFEPLRLPPTLRTELPPGANPTVMACWVDDHGGYAPVKEDGIDYLAPSPRLLSRLGELLEHPALCRVSRLTLELDGGELCWEGLVGHAPLRQLTLLKTTLEAPIPPLPAIEELDLTGCVVHDDALIQLVGAAPGLRMLHLPDGPISGAALDAVLSLPELHTLRVRGLSPDHEEQVRQRVETALLE